MSSFGEGLLFVVLGLAVSVAHRVIQDSESSGRENRNPVGSWPAEEGRAPIA